MNLFTKIMTGVLALGLTVIVILVAYPDKPVIPGPIKVQLTSTLLVPHGSSYTTDRTSVKYDAKLKLLTFHTHIKDLTDVIISEQPTPDQFTDIPTYGDKVFQQFGEYKTFETAIGTVHLVHPPQQKGMQSAGINTQGTLMFVKPATELSDDQWKQFFRNVVVVR